MRSNVSADLQKKINLDFQLIVGNTTMVYPEFIASSQAQSIETMITQNPSIRLVRPYTQPQGTFRPITVDQMFLISNLPNEKTKWVYEVGKKFQNEPVLLTCKNITRNCKLKFDFFLPSWISSSKNNFTILPNSEISVILTLDDEAAANLSITEKNRSIEDQISIVVTTIDPPLVILVNR
jgi:hypothetical protein